jgi:hypothetical protein
LVAFQQQSSSSCLWEFPKLLLFYPRTPLLYQPAKKHTVISWTFLHVNCEPNKTLDQYHLHDTYLRIPCVQFVHQRR